MRKGVFQKAAGLLLMLVLCMSLWCVHAAGEHVSDAAGLFSRTVAETLEEDAKTCGQQIGADLVIATINWDTGKQSEEYARSVLLDGGYGYGSGREAIIFLIDMFRREYTVYEYNTDASGYLLTDYEGDCILDALEQDMKSGRYDQAAETFIDLCVHYAGTDLGGNYESAGRLHATPRQTSPIVFLIIGLTGGAAVTVLLVISHKENQAVSAGVYTPERAMELINRDDHFVRTTVVKRRIERTPKSGGRSGGGRSHSGFSGGRSGGGHGGSRRF